jgi:hypothetical protein
MDPPSLISRTQFDQLSDDLARYLCCFAEIKDLPSYPCFNKYQHDPIFRSMYLDAHFFELNTCCNDTSNDKMKHKNQNTIYHIHELADIGVHRHYESFDNKYDQMKRQQKYIQTLGLPLGVRSVISIADALKLPSIYYKRDGQDPIIFKSTLDIRLAIDNPIFQKDLLNKYLDQYLFKKRICRYDCIIIDGKSEFGGYLFFYLDVTSETKDLIHQSKAVRYNYQCISGFQTSINSNYLPEDIDVLYSDIPILPRYPFRYFSRLFLVYALEGMTISLTDNVRSQCINNYTNNKTTFIDEFDGKVYNIKLTNKNRPLPFNRSTFEQKDKLRLTYQRRKLSNKHGFRYYQFSVTIELERPISHISSVMTALPGRT